MMMMMRRRNKFDDDHDHKENEQDDHDDDHELLKFHLPLKTREFDSLQKSDRSVWAAKGSRWRVGDPRIGSMDSWSFCLHLKNKLQTTMDDTIASKIFSSLATWFFSNHGFFIWDSHGSVLKLPVTLSQTPGEDSPHNLFMPSAEEWHRPKNGGKMGPSKGDDPHF